MYLKGRYIEETVGVLDMAFIVKKNISGKEFQQMMEEIHITNLKHKDEESVEIKKIYGASITAD